MASSLIERMVHARRARPGPDAMTLGEHLGELRHRLLVVVLAFVVAACIAAAFYNWQLGLLRHPYCAMYASATCRFYVTGPLDPLVFRIKLATFGGLVLASPVLLWELWRFVTPGLQPSEKRYAVPFIVASIAFFLGGCALVYAVLPHTLGWLVGVGGPSLHELLNPNAYLTLVLLLMVLFGITFELPVVLVALQAARVVSSRALLAHWRWAIIAITVASAVLTPSSDPFSMCALALPLAAFYFGAIGMGRLLGR